MRIGYARVSTQDQNPDLQLDALKKAGCEEIFQEKFSGKSAARPELENCLRMLRKGDVLVVWRLDRLGRSLKDLVEIVSALEDRGVGFQSLTENIDTVSAGGKLVRCQPWRAKRRLIDPSSREAALFSRRALRQRENKVGLRTRR
ncbi:recombinase family protein, partial [Thiolapillus sp.]|uniref:recombinase family protein n=1 Tax=Thiolapillus sp. TaxID=2017437 RepID=UPI003AF42421